MERTIKQRRTSDKRREKSRDAARQRRTQETNVFTELAKNLPIPESKSSQLDKASIMRLTLTTLKQKKLKALLCGGRKEDKELSEEEQRTLALHTKALDGFLLVVSKDGEILFLSDQVIKFLGIVHIEFMGQNIFEFTHPCDHDEFREMFSEKSFACERDPYRRSFSVRLKCTLTNKGRNINIKSASYKVIKFTGYIFYLPKGIDPTTVTVKIENGEIENQILQNDKNKNGDLMTYLFAFGEQIPHPSNIEVPLGQKTFLSQHSMDMKFTIWDEKIKELVGYNSDDIIGRPLYDYYHVLDGELVGKTFKDLIGKGQIMTEQYRFLAKRGGHVWVVTQATIIYDQRSQKSQYVVCVHYVLSEILDRHEIVSIVQLAGCDDEEEVEEVKEVLAIENKEVLVDLVQSPASEESIPGPQLNTEKIFAPKTKDMEEEIFAQNNTAIPVNECMQDLTYRAPSAGDVCISLPFPTFGNGSDVTDSSVKIVKLKDEPIEEPTVFIWDSNEELTFQQSPHVGLLTPTSTDSEAQDFAKSPTTDCMLDSVQISGSYYSTDILPGSSMMDITESPTSDCMLDPLQPLEFSSNPSLESILMNNTESPTSNCMLDPLQPLEFSSNPSLESILMNDAESLNSVLDPLQPSEFSSNPSLESILMNDTESPTSDCRLNPMQTSNEVSTNPSFGSCAMNVMEDTTTCYSSDPIRTSYGSCFSTDLSPGSCVSAEFSPGSCTIKHSDDATNDYTSDPLKTYGPCFATDLSPGSCISTELSPESSVSNSAEMACPPDNQQNSEENSVRYSTMDTDKNFNGRPYYKKKMKKDSNDKGKSLYEQEEWKIKTVFPDYNLRPYSKNELSFNVNSPESPKKSPEPDITNNVPNVQLMQNGSDLSHAKRQIDISCLEKGPPGKKAKIDPSTLPSFGNFPEESVNSPIMTEEPNTDSVLRNLLVNGEDLNNGYSVNRPSASSHFMTDLLDLDSKSMPMPANRALLPRLTQSDCDVNAPVPSNGLLRGNDILKALDVDTSLII